MPYFHVVYTLPAEIGDIAYQNKAVIYDLLFKASAETTLTIAADPEHLGARIGFISVLHTWGSAMTHHPHIHMIVPGGGLAPDGSKWIACRPRYFLTVEVLSALFRRLFLQMLVAAHHAGRLQFFGDHARLADKAAFKAYLAPLRKINWVVYAKEPFAGPRQVLRYLSRYTHRIAISNRRLVSADENGVTFKYKDYRIEGPARYKTMTLAADEFIRRFLIHVLPKGFHRIRHYGLLSSGRRAENIAHVRELLALPAPAKQPEPPKAAIDEPRVLPQPCPCCGSRMIIIETFARGCEPKHQKCCRSQGAPPKHVCVPLSAEHIVYPPILFERLTMTHTVREKSKLLARVRRIRGQVEAIERALETEVGCADVLQVIASVRGAVNGLMAEVIEGSHPLSCGTAVTAGE